MKNQHYFIIGGGTLQYNFVEKVKQNGFIAHVFDYDSNCRCSKIADYFHCISIDAQDEIMEIAKKYKPIAIQTTATEMGNISTCYVGEKLGLRTNSYKTSLDTTDKSRMKKIFAQNNIPNAKYLEVTNLLQINFNELKFPLVIKASDRSAGRGVKKVSDKKEFEEAFEDALEQSNNKKVLIEECMEGAQYSVETITSNGNHQIVAITEETFDGSDSFIENRHILPANLNENLVNELKSIIIKTLDSFKVKFGASHIEVKLTEDGFKIIEVATRMGGLRDFMVKNALGCDYNQLLIDATLGKEIKIEYTKNKYAVMIFVIHKKDYELYKKIKKENPQQIIHEEVHEFYSTIIPTTLMDSQGFFYLLFDNEEDANKIIRGVV